jgi:hypothetical protein
LAVVPRCSFVESYVQRHPEYADLLPESGRERSGASRSRWACLSPPEPTLGPRWR